MVKGPFIILIKLYFKTDHGRIEKREGGITMGSQFIIGKNSYTKLQPLASTLPFLDKQLELSVPLITGVKLCLKKGESLQIYVGKQINLKDYTEEKYLRHKFDIPVDTIASLAVEGYDRACLLNYKKYEPVLVGVSESDLIVPDYYSLRDNIKSYLQI